MSEIRVLVLADDPLARAGLGALLAQQEAVVVVGQTAVAELDAALAAYLPAVLLLDCGWDAGASIDALAEWNEASPPHGDEAAERSPAVVALVADDEQAADAWAASVHGLLPRESDANVIVAALVAAANDLLVLAPQFATGSAMAGSFPAASDEEYVEPLTPRELEVLQLVAEGLPNKNIARQLQISEHTVKFHLNSILGKLNASSRTEAVVRATRAGFILL